MYIKTPEGWRPLRVLTVNDNVRQDDDQLQFMTAQGLRGYILAERKHGYGYVVNNFLLGKYDYIHTVWDELAGCYVPLTNRTPRADKNLFMHMMRSGEGL